MSAASATVIDLIAAALNSEQSLGIILHGHADQRGNLYYTMNLSLHRAGDVRTIPVKESGCEPL